MILEEITSSTNVKVSRQKHKNMKQSNMTPKVHNFPGTKSISTNGYKMLEQRSLKTDY